MTCELKRVRSNDGLRSPRQSAIAGIAEARTRAEEARGGGRVWLRRPSLCTWRPPSLKIVFSLATPLLRAVQYDADGEYRRPRRVAPESERSSLRRLTMKKAIGINGAAFG